MNAVLERLLTQRADQVRFIDELLARVDAEQRDLVPAEQHNLEAARQRIRELDEQIEPIRAFEELRGTHESTLANLRSPRRDASRSRAKRLARRSGPPLEPARSWSTCSSRAA